MGRGKSSLQWNHGWWTMMNNESKEDILRRRLYATKNELEPIMQVEIELTAYKHLLTHQNIDEPFFILSRALIEERVDSLMRQANQMRLALAEKATTRLYRELGIELARCASSIPRIANHVVDNFKTNMDDLLPTAEGIYYDVTGKQRSFPFNLRPLELRIPITDKVRDLAMKALAVEDYRNELRGMEDDE